MIIQVDLEHGATVVAPEELTAFHAVSTTTDSSAVGPAMGDAGDDAGEGHVWVSADWIRSQVADEVSGDWRSSFDGMIAYAASKGWMNEAGTHIKAHIEPA